MSFQRKPDRELIKPITVYRPISKKRRLEKLARELGLSLSDLAGKILDEWEQKQVAQSG